MAEKTEVYAVTKSGKTLAIYDTYSKAEEVYNYLKRKALKEALDKLEAGKASQVEVIEAHTNRTSSGCGSNLRDNIIYDVKLFEINNDNNILN